MQSCSVHHCVLFLLTLTLTTDPGSAFSFPIYAKLNESVTLPCGAPCSGRAQWALDSDRDVVFARCDQTSCTSLKDGYEMSYDQFKNGDFSLTITKPDYSMRETYTCECDYSEFATARLRISTMFSAVQMSPGEDLKLDVSVPESVEVIYRGSDSAEAVQICNVTQRSLQCKSEYTPRTSLSNLELTLRHMERSESGTYTIRNLDYKEDIRVYAVSVSGLTRGEIVGIVIGVLLLLLAWLLTAGVFMYREHRVDSDMNAVDKAPLDQMEKMIDALEQKYSKDRFYSGRIKDFCDRKRRELVKRLRVEVDELYRKFIKHLYEGEKEEAEKVKKTVLDKIDSLKSKHGEGDNPEGDVNMFCNYIRILLNAQHFFSETEFAKLLLEKRDEAVEILKNLKHEASGTRFTTDEQLSEMTSRVKSLLRWIDSECHMRRVELNHFKQEVLGKESDDTPIRYMEALLNELQHWSKDNQSELTKYTSNEDPSTLHNGKGEEDTLLTKI